MTQIRKSDIAKIKELDLLTYFKNYGQDELIRNGRNESYYLRHHDSLKLSNGMWYWWSRGIGGKTALDYLIKVEGFTFNPKSPANKILSFKKTQSSLPASRKKR